eukprot:334620-Chlamydomonas_euryale.AAC.1
MLALRASRTQPMRLHARLSSHPAPMPHPPKTCARACPRTQLLCPIPPNLRAQGVHLDACAHAAVPPRRQDCRPRTPCVRWCRHGPRRAAVDGGVSAADPEARLLPRRPPPWERVGRGGARPTPGLAAVLRLWHVGVGMCGCVCVWGGGLRMEMAPTHTRARCCPTALTCGCV